ncbi:unnamed protein product [Caenorhabditis brenneri]
MLCLFLILIFTPLSFPVPAPIGPGGEVRNIDDFEKYIINNPMGRYTTPPVPTIDPAERDRYGSEIREVPDSSNKTCGERLIWEAMDVCGQMSCEAGEKNGDLYEICDGKNLTKAQVKDSCCPNKTIDATETF